MMSITHVDTSLTDTHHTVTALTLSIVPIVSIIVVTLSILSVIIKGLGLGFWLWLS